MKISILVVLHKEAKVPKNDIFSPITVGKYTNANYLSDSTGINISQKNPYYSELTAIYWGWKNMDYDYLGLNHYRRYFKSKLGNHIITNDEIINILNKYDVILPVKRKYYIETLYSHYKNTLYVEPLDICSDIIKELYPDYTDAFHKLKSARSGYMFNMFVMKNEILDRYLKWLFTILEELEKRVEQDKYDDFHKRFYGRISELLLNVWLYNNHINYKEVRTIQVGNKNTLKKFYSFLKAKLSKKKYKGSF